jgi:hypothetical protein
MDEGIRQEGIKILPRITGRLNTNNNEYKEKSPFMGL